MLGHSNVDETRSVMLVGYGAVKLGSWNRQVKSPSPPLWHLLVKGQMDAALSDG